jgi:hypothetical protein
MRRELAARGVVLADDGELDRAVGAARDRRRRRLARAKPAVDVVRAVGIRPQLVVGHAAHGSPVDLVESGGAAARCARQVRVRRSAQARGGSVDRRASCQP